MTIKRESITKNNLDKNNRSSFNNKSYSKLNDRQVDDNFNKYNDYDLRSFVDRYASQFSFYFRYIFYQYQNSTYQQ